jgi:hypothetical protein
MKNETASNLRLSLFRGINTYKPTLTPTIFEFDDAGDTRVKRIVAADADICAWFEF